MSKKSFDDTEYKYKTDYLYARASTSSKLKNRPKSSKNEITTLNSTRTYASRDKVTKSVRNKSSEKDTYLDHEITLHQLKAQVEQLHLDYGSSLPEIERKYNIGINLPMRNNFFDKEVCNDTNAVLKKLTSVSKKVQETKRIQKRRVHKPCTFNRNITSQSNFKISHSSQVGTSGAQSETRSTVLLLDKNASLHRNSADSEYQSDISNTSADIFKKPRRFYRRGNKIKPESASSTSTTKSSSSKLVLKYYEDTPDLSSYSLSTVSPNVSSCVSNSTRESTPKSINDLETLPNVSQMTSVLTSSKPFYKFVETFDPSYCCSLDIPKKLSAQITFPSFTKITTFIDYSEDLVGDKGSIENDTKSFSNVAKNCENETNYNLTNDTIHNKRTSAENIVNKKNEFSFYTNSSTDSAVDAEEHLNKNIDLFTIVDSDEEQQGSCSCICNWMFPKNRNRYFS